MSVQIPDVDPRTLPTQSKFSMVAGDFLEVPFRITYHINHHIIPLVADVRWYGMI
jgi:hypothetical protein